MNILLFFDEKLPIDPLKIVALLESKCDHVKFCLGSIPISIDTNLVNGKTFPKVQRQIAKEKVSFDRTFFFTSHQYTDNFFFYEYGDLTIFSFFQWDYLTDLPHSNGALYFIISYLTSMINHQDFRHQNVTGCIYDFLWEKKGIDDGMRQSRFCTTCLTRLNKTLKTKVDLAIFEDVKKLMNYLSECSRWNKDILSEIKDTSTKVQKRRLKKADAVRVVIASPGDTAVERDLLLNSLELKFRKHNHEAHCGHRIIVTGWEDLSSQPGYAQDVINDKIIAESDFVVALFRHKLGTPTINARTGKTRTQSGTAEELLQALDWADGRSPIGMAYFFSQAPKISLDSVDKKKIEREWNRLTKFKDSIKNKMIYKPYTDPEELVTIILHDLEKNIVDYIKS